MCGWIFAEASALQCTKPDPKIYIKFGGLKSTQKIYKIPKVPGYKFDQITRIPPNIDRLPVAFPAYTEIKKRTFPFLNKNRHG